VKRAAIILAGGAGTRLWPLSSDDNPKQFLRLFDGQSLLQKTYARLLRSIAPELIYISTNERYRAKCVEQLPLLPKDNILTEPARRNTAPAIALCMFEVEAREGDAVVAVLPADHFIADEPAFLRILGRAYQHAESSDDLVTIGIDPTHAETGFGYLELGDEIAQQVIRLKRFAEKPSRAQAEEFLAAGNFVWNGGIFIWRTSVFRAALENAAPQLATVTRANYESMESISIDYALMEKAPRVATVRGNFGWSDVGSWAAISKLIAKPNANLHTADAGNVFVIAEKPVAVVGVSDIAVIDSPDGLLVLDLRKSELLSAVVKKMP
jgi:mannose-1-phosphate guanylyltransferase